MWSILYNKSLSDISFPNVFSYSMEILAHNQTDGNTFKTTIRKLKSIGKTKVLEKQKYWSFSFSICPSNEYSGLISFRIDCFDLLAVQGNLKSLLQRLQIDVQKHILWCSAFFIVHLSHPYMTTRKTITLTRWTFVGKVMSLLFNVLSRLVIAFLPRSRCLLISWLQSPSIVFWSPKE